MQNGVSKILNEFSRSTKILTLQEHSKNTCLKSCIKIEYLSSVKLILSLWKISLNIYLRDSGSIFTRQLVTFVSDTEKNGMDIEYVREFLGHEYLETTQLYTHLTNKNLKVKLLLGINSWLVNKLDQIFIQLIELISQGKLEFRVQTENLILNRAIIIDDTMLFQIVTDRKTISSYKALVIRNPIRILEIKAQFNRIFEQGMDFRNAIMQYEINKDLEESEFIYYIADLLSDSDLLYMSDNSGSGDSTIYLVHENKINEIRDKIRIK